jgi:chromosome segregation ATPase
MKKMLFVFFIFPCLCSCEEKVSVSLYNTLQQKMAIAEEEYDEIFMRYKQLQNQYEELNNNIDDLNEELVDLQENVIRAQDKVDVLIREYDEWFYNSHSFLTLDDLASDASDIKSALEGKIQIFKVRVNKYGIKY